MNVITQAAVPGSTVRPGFFVHGKHRDDVGCSGIGLDCLGGGPTGDRGASIRGGRQSVGKKSCREQLNWPQEAAPLMMGPSVKSPGRVRPSPCVFPLCSLCCTIHHPPFFPPVPPSPVLLHPPPSTQAVPPSPIHLPSAPRPWYQWRLGWLQDLTGAVISLLVARYGRNSLARRGRAARRQGWAADRPCKSTSTSHWPACPSCVRRCPRAIPSPAQGE